MAVTSWRDQMRILANTITADMGMIPGLAFVGPAMGLPLSVLAAFVGSAALFVVSFLRPRAKTNADVGVAGEGAAV